ncbi:hypothetical protein BD324DRAFT_617183 [Kockovaella imperatae]|uniref:Uncharacterized protein n=1 Tax=Kockovaella imperatae TaxID=4999 RepID=A0A1Y1USV2_9TREE|nr:hypothetical protein BD324DRAFT_617183 [Kockovaella imperatae]ORX40285.1 hypothetical protein BD324DRAFT_617183 [Kockovaella imperatae]
MGVARLDTDLGGEPVTEDGEEYPLLKVANARMDTSNDATRAEEGTVLHPTREKSSQYRSHHTRRHSYSNNSESHGGKGRSLKRHPHSEESVTAQTYDTTLGSVHEELDAPPVQEEASPMMPDGDQDGDTRDNDGTSARRRKHQHGQSRKNGSNRDGERNSRPSRRDRSRVRSGFMF